MVETVGEINEMYIVLGCSNMRINMDAFFNGYFNEAAHANIKIAVEKCASYA